MAILSTSKEGLQTSLNIIENFCKTWGLNINTQKTKVMVFKGGGKVPSETNFALGGDTLEIVKSYSYLGVTFTPNGSMKTVITDLKAKAAKAMFKLQGILHNQHINCPKLHLKLFDTLIRPILTYGCQVWGLDLLHHTKNGLPNFDRTDREPPEKLCNVFYKCVLGIKKHSPNIPNVQNFAGTQLSYTSLNKSQNSGAIPSVPNPSSLTWRCKKRRPKKDPKTAG